MYLYSLITISALVTIAVTSSALANRCSFREFLIAEMGKSPAVTNSGNMAHASKPHIVLAVILFDQRCRAEDFGCLYRRDE
jgi:hypothetical protein